MKREEGNDKKLWILGLILLIVAVGTIVGVSLAYFSDVVNEDDNTLDVANLDSDKTVKRYYLKNDGTEAIDNLTFDHDGVLALADNFNPGDILEVTFNIKNNGNKSLWVRDMYSLTVKDYNNDNLTESGIFVLYKSSSSISLSDIRNGVAINPISAVATGISQTYTTPVIYNGGSTNSDMNEYDGGINTRDNPQTSRYYLYFKGDAPDEYLNANVTLNLRIEAVEYRQNENPLAIDWSDAQSLSTEVRLK